MKLNMAVLGSNSSFDKLHEETRSAFSMFSAYGFSMFSTLFLILFSLTIYGQHTRHAKGCLCIEDLQCLSLVVFT